MNNVSNVRELSREPAKPENEQQGFWERLGRPKVMTADRAKAQGIFIPNWWIAVLLIPALAAVIWVAMTLTEIKANQAASTQLWELRLHQMEVDVKLKDEHARQLETRIARVEGAKGIVAPVDNGQ